MSSLDRTFAVIMAGGVGSRFWPLSRARRPKQLLDLFGHGSMLRATFERLAPLVPAERQLVVTSALLGDAVRQALPELPPANVLEEPTGRNTAPAIGWAALEVQRRDPAGLLAVLPADQFIADVPRYREIVTQAISACAADRIVTLGIPPTRPETGYGYIRAGASAACPEAPELREVAAFHEKPDLDTALEWLASGGYLWNAGMFFLPATLALSELARYEPELARGLDALYDGGAPPDAARLAAVYPTLRSISIDYAVMERSDRAAVIPGDFGWSDVGSWRTLWDFRPEGAESFSRGRVIEIDGGGNVLLADGDGLVATVGVRDLVVVHTADATLVCPREASQRVRDIVTALQSGQGDPWL
ncbi:MAG: mannose-1-phosphate guanylyltransferase [Deltaproteobacteria bacterium]|nr:mannose-1-phosphate guanylyltransferase [Deltaproteobacteria bacterium]MCB9785570.1 mannose-1-phosphate guanylyltransferase [Deltaproteobacteria bacterium]